MGLKDYERGPLYGDIIDTRDLAKRLRWLEDKRDEAAGAREEAGADASEEALADIDADDLDEDEREELKELETLEHEVGEWKDGNALIAEHYFKTYAQDLAEDIGALSRSAAWPVTHIDWDGAADALKADYSEVTYQGTTYLVRDC